MVATTTAQRQPSKLDYSSQIQFRFDSHEEFADLLREGTPSQRTPSSKGIQRPLPEIGTYSDATLTILSSKNMPKTEIRFKNIFPTSISGLDYNIGGTDVDYITCSASFSYLGYTINQISTT